MAKLRAVAGLGILLLLAGCGVGSSGSRHALYGSLDALIDDSTLVVVGEALAVEETLFAGHPSSVATFRVDEQYLSADPLDEIAVRQTAPAPALVVGTTYLLFLTSTGLPDDPPTTFYVTGAVAGIYEASGDEFRRMSDEDPGLPETVSRDDLF